MTKTWKLEMVIDGTDPWKTLFSGSSRILHGIHRPVAAPRGLASTTATSKIRQVSFGELRHLMLQTSPMIAGK
jgi:hypothetical protein